MTPIQAAIAANIDALARMLESASAMAQEASEAAREGKLNLAIGTLTAIQNTTPEAATILAAIFALNRLDR